MDAAIDKGILTVEEYIRQYEQDGAFEIIDGIRSEIVPNVMIHVWTVRLLVRLLEQYCGKYGSGEIFSEAPFVLEEKPGWVKGSRVPDVMFIAAKRWADYTASTADWKTKPLLLVPDLVVEVVSQTDLYSELQNKVDHYLTDGVKVVWIVDPNRQQAAIYAGDRYQSLTRADALTAPSLLPDLKIVLSAVFETE